MTEPFQMKLTELNAILQRQLPGARLVRQVLPDCGGLSLYLIDPQFDDRNLPTDVRESISDDPPYWIFCWASGRALAQQIMRGDIDVKDKCVLDFGAGSGVVAIAAMLAGARMATACDIDPVANTLMAINAASNQTTLDIVRDIDACRMDYDKVFAADVLYETKNLVWLDRLLMHGNQVIIADSRQKNLQHPRYSRVAQVTTTSFPDFAEAKTFNEVNIYRSRPTGATST